MRIRILGTHYNTRIRILKGYTGFCRKNIPWPDVAVRIGAGYHEGMLQACISAMCLLGATQSATVIRGGIVYDGTGSPGRRADVRIVGDTVVQVGTVKVRAGDKVIDATGLAVAPGFIDAHSHADGGIFEDRNAETHIRQGITTSVVGEDGGSHFPLADFFGHLQADPAALNFASFVGHGTIRHEVMGDANRKPTDAEEAKMRSLVDQEMRAGALGLSTGLEYVPNRYANTDEVVDLATVAAKDHGIYISHVRNEDKYAFQAFKELIEVAERAKIPAEINHIKLGSSVVWHRAPEVIAMMKAARKQGLDITADVYPYLYWQSTIRVLIATENFDDRKQWEQGLADIGGADRVLLTSYSPDPSWAGKTLAQIAASTGKDPVTVAQEVVSSCYGPGKHGEESVVVSAMCEDDLRTFIGCPLISFCSDGGLHVTHPRGAGSFPRDLGVYVREARLLSLSEAIRKMTSQPAARFGFKDRGRIAPGMKADITLFDPSKVIDTATTSSPWSAPLGIPTVLVNGVPVLLNGKITGAHPGRPLPRAGSEATWTTSRNHNGPWRDSSPVFDAGGG